jgi:hypothetical protein
MEHFHYLYDVWKYSRNLNFTDLLTSHMPTRYIQGNTHFTIKKLMIIIMVESFRQVFPEGDMYSF